MRNYFSQLLAIKLQAVEFHHILNCFMHRLINGAEYLFTAKDESDCISWINHINAAIHHRQC